MGKERFISTYLHFSSLSLICWLRTELLVWKSLFVCLNFFSSFFNFVWSAEQRRERRRIRLFRRLKTKTEEHFIFLLSVLLLSTASGNEYGAVSSEGLRSWAKTSFRGSLEEMEICRLYRQKSTTEVPKCCRSR